MSFRKAGIFSVVSIALPFGFEGKKRMRSVENLLPWLRSTADFVAIIDQVPIGLLAAFCTFLLLLLAVKLLVF